MDLNGKNKRSLLVLFVFITGIILPSCKVEARKLIAAGQYVGLCIEIYQNAFINKKQAKEHKKMTIGMAKRKVKKCPTKKAVLICSGKHDGKTFKGKFNRKLGRTDFKFYYYSPKYTKSKAEDKCLAQKKNGYEVSY